LATSSVLAAFSLAFASSLRLISASHTPTTFLDSDDEFSPLHLESRKAVLEQNPKIGFLYGGAEIIGNQYVPDRFDHSKRINLKNCAIGGTVPEW